MWPSYGFSIAESWREDGFCLIYRGSASAEEAAVEEGAVVALARRFGQGAIFAYRRHGTDASALVRTTVPCVLAAAPEVVVVRRVPAPLGVRPAYSTPCSASDGGGDTHSVLPQHAPGKPATNNHESTIINQ